MCTVVYGKEWKTSWLRAVGIRTILEVILIIHGVDKIYTAILLENKWRVLSFA